jgi:hypothetical protein
MGSTVALLLSQMLPCARPLDNGLGRVPVMGDNAWFDMTALDLGGLNESMVRKTADKLVQLGLDKLGYQYLLSGNNLRPGPASLPLFWGPITPSLFPGVGT